MLVAESGDSRKRPKLTLVSLSPRACGLEAGPLMPANASTPDALIVIAVAAAMVEPFESVTLASGRFSNVTAPDR